MQTTNNKQQTTNNKQQTTLDAVKSVLAVQSPTQATALLAQTILRSVIGESELDSLLMERTQINQKSFE